MSDACNRQPPHMLIGVFTQITLVGLAELMVERYDPYIEYGAIAYDDVDGVVRVRISIASSGGGVAVLASNNTLNTSVVTPPGEPVMVRGRRAAAAVVP